MPKVPLITRVDIQTADDAQHTLFRFTTKSGKNVYAMKNKELSQLASLLLTQSGKVALVQPERPPEKMNLTVVPVPASGLGIAKGTTDETTTLVVQVGNLNLAFEMSADAVEGFADDVSSVLPTLSKPKRTN